MVDVDDRVVIAVQSLVRSTPRAVSVSDVAAASGLDFNTTQSELVKLASLITSTTLEVSNEGDILYEFPSNVSAALSQVSQAARFRQLVKKAAPVISYVARVSFGLTLLVSLVAVFSIIAIISSSSSSDDRDNRRRDSSPVFFPSYNFFGPTWFDVFWYDPYYYQRRYYQRQEQPGKSMSFLESVFSFVFGDGNPDFDLDDKRYKEVARVIRANKGVVVSEQLRPLLDPSDEDKYAGDVVSERFMLPVLTRFNGRPEVSSSGDIVYVFPELQKTATQVEYVRKDPRALKMPKLLLEQTRPFSLASAGQKLATVVLGAVNLFGVLRLGVLLQDPRVLASPALHDSIPLFKTMYSFFSGYALIFVLVPIIRYFWLKNENRRIEQRNAWREQGIQVLENAVLNGDSSAEASMVREKIAGSEKFVLESGVIDRKKSVYRSDQDLKRDDNMLDEFDRRLKGRK